MINHNDMEKQYRIRKNWTFNLNYTWGINA
jgi:hypothetical protein